jgi:protein-disulfide isomerase
MPTRPSRPHAPRNAASWLCARLLLTATAVLGCSENKPDTGPDCARYATMLCKEAGADSSSCGSAKEMAALLPPAACRAAIDGLDTTRRALADARKACGELSTRLCAALGPQTEACSTVKAHVAALPVQDCTISAGDYAALLADLKDQAAASQPLTPEVMSRLAELDAPSFGPQQARVTVVEFSDFECPYCSGAAKVVTQLKQAYSDRVRFVFRQLPLSMHPNARLAAEAALAAHAQGKFWEFHDRLFADQSQLARAGLEASARALGLDMVAFNAALDDNRHAAAVEADIGLAETARVDGTPSMYVNGISVPDATSFELVAKQIDAELNKPSS